MSQSVLRLFDLDASVHICRHLFAPMSFCNVGRIGEALAEGTANGLLDVEIASVTRMNLDSGTASFEGTVLPSF